MNGAELIENMIDELNRTIDLLNFCEPLVKSNEISDDFVFELGNDIRNDLDRYYDNVNEILSLLKNLEVE